MADDNSIYPPAQPWTPPKAGSRPPLCCWVAVISSLTSVVLAVLLWIRTAPPAAAPPVAAQATAPAAAQAQAARPSPGSIAIPVALQPYLDAAQKGDTHAMRMLGAMYYHGLDLPRNRDEGLKWYRKAADAGSKVAKDELRQLE
jgi:TPR repeat protein